MIAIISGTYLRISSTCIMVCHETASRQGQIVKTSSSKDKKEINIKKQGAGFTVCFLREWNGCIAPKNSV